MPLFANASLRSAVGRQVAAQLSASFLDADDHHSPAAKGACLHAARLHYLRRARVLTRASAAAMASGRALTDEDRAPWLERVAAAAVSALQR